MVEKTTVGRTQELRQKFEERYEKYFPDFKEAYLSEKNWARGLDWSRAFEKWEQGEESECPQLLENFRAYQAHCEAGERMQELWTSDHRTFQIVRHLMIPFSERLDRLEEKELRNPRKPANKKQTLCAIESVDEEIREAILPLMWESIRPDDEDWGNVGVIERGWIRELERQKAVLEARLSLFQGSPRVADKT